MVKRALTENSHLSEDLKGLGSGVASERKSVTDRTANEKWFQVGRGLKESRGHGGDSCELRYCVEWNLNVRWSFGRDRQALVSIVLRWYNLAVCAQDPADYCVRNLHV